MQTAKCKGMKYIVTVSSMHLAQESFIANLQ